jgi:hypothetical protein
MIELLSKAPLVRFSYRFSMKLSSPNAEHDCSAFVAEHTTLERNERRLFVLWRDWTWWVWSATAVLLAMGLLGFTMAFVAAGIATALQTIALLIRERSVTAFPVQLRIAYGVLLAICFIPQMRWLYWLPTLGTFALVIFGYCLMARVLSLLPWNRIEPLSLELLLRTFISKPSMERLVSLHGSTGCAGRMCTIEAQVRRPGFIA